MRYNTGIIEIRTCDFTIVRACFICEHYQFITDAIDDCVFDACLVPDDAVDEMVCNAFDELVQACAGGNVGNWRDAAQCPRT